MPDENRTLMEDSADLGLSQDEFVPSLRRSVTRSECHSHIAARLPLSCGSEEHEGQVSESNRRAIAISFTLCSMQSALQPVPNECLPWWQLSEPPVKKPSRIMSVWSNTPPGESDRQALCLGQVFLCPQDWNSYNTFLSDASEIGYTAKQTQSESSPVTAQLCHVLQGQQEIAQARELYANATMEKIALLKYLKKKDQDRLQRELKLEEYIEHQSTELQATSRELKTASCKMQLAIDQYELLSTALDQSIQSLATGRERLWENVQENIQYETTLAGQLFTKELHQLQDMLSKKLTAQLGMITDQYGVALNAQAEAADSLVKSLQYQMQNYLSDLTTQQTAQMSTLQHSWEILTYQTSRLVGDLQNLETGAKALQGVLEQSHDIAISTKISQELAATWLQAGVEQAERISTSLNETEGRMDLVLTSLEARQQQLDQSWRWSPSLFAYSSGINIAGARQVGLCSNKLPRFTGGVGYMLASYLLHGIRYGLPFRRIASWNEKALCARIRSGGWGPTSR
ncbi:hypothetical protein CNBJ0710 [Cryptococcus deneoformans B-3501A]|uniref:hypothetical protein n=1 Tax=Cryptococcus deneoformans (strain B-3501A) TaxID=283643 RepID=UPI000042C1BC|nr:hypothetical protein CNBJ0710 [Cryptococcus neoformans var. neoformans B-3501A]EAL18429.1 hypothetical protein CNBJ0710 [Cryptococcus neoformans var. neoformans B-3501A]